MANFSDTSSFRQNPNTSRKTNISQNDSDVVYSERLTTWYENVCIKFPSENTWNVTARLSTHSSLVAHDVLFY